MHLSRILYPIVVVIFLYQLIKAILNDSLQTKYSYKLDNIKNTIYEDTSYNYNIFNVSIKKYKFLSSKVKIVFFLNRINNRCKIIKTIKVGGKSINLKDKDYLTNVYLFLDNIELFFNNYSYLKDGDIDTSFKNRALYKKGFLEIVNNKDSECEQLKKDYRRLVSIDAQLEMVRNERVLLDKKELILLNKKDSIKEKLRHNRAML